MRLTNIFLIVLAFALPCTQTNPGVTDSVNIIKKFAQDLQSSPSGYSFHHHSDSVHPGGYGADINHGGAKIAGQLGMEKYTEMNGHRKSGSYRVAGGYGFMISHDYGSQKTHTEAPYIADAHFGASNADHASIAVLQFGSKDSGDPITNADNEKSEDIGTGEDDGANSYIGKEIYGSYMEYDKLVKDSKKGPSVYPGEYYESDVYGGKEKYDSDDGNGESNNGRDKGRYLESEKYYGSEDYNEDKHYGPRRGHDDYIDDGETERYITQGNYDQLDDNNPNDRVELYERYYGDSEYNNEEDNPFKTNEKLTNNNRNYGTPSKYSEYDDDNKEPRYEDIRKSFLDDFFKEYNEFSKGANIQAGYKHDLKFDDDYYGDHKVDDYYGDHRVDDYYGDHGVEDEHSVYAENGENEKNFFDDAYSNGDHHEEEEGEKNSNFGEKKGHKKGSKTTGYRNVLHKDEYTKDHTFYEHAKNNGHFNKDGDYNEHDYHDEGSHEKSQHHDSSSHDDHHGKTDSEDKGHSLYDNLSDHDEHGYKTYFDDNYDYSDGGDSRYGSEYEFNYD